ncbi:uncharacterized protein L203_104274 [Cryptococcus depauperatus CBS 7841]|uniref:Pet127-domain-containing protein n=1 Tax=Cryptococcus depauperatus CBS 7841 TaxID=1295531 RepID=A0AAJ8JV65_9TREE
MFVNRSLASSSTLSSLVKESRQASLELQRNSGQQSKQRNDLQKSKVSLSQQARIELAKDLSYATSLQLYRKKAASKSPSILIKESVRKDISQKLRRNTKRMLSQSIVLPGLTPSTRKPKNAIHQDATISHQNLHNISSSEQFGQISANKVEVEKVAPLQEKKIARLRDGLSRVLFDPGVHSLRDPRTGNWNFDASLHDIPHPKNFAFHRCSLYVTPSQDKNLLELAQRHKCSFYGSTSTVGKALSQIYFALSGGRGVDTTSFSQVFSTERSDFTRGAALPAMVTLSKKSELCYSIDNDKTYDTDNILSDFGHVLEKMLTSSSQEFKRFLLSSPEDTIPEGERQSTEAYYYKKVGSLLMRSQLDCYHPGLPGTGVFDIKTRACFPIRYDRANYLANSVYDVWKDKGYTGSYEREYYDLLRAAMLKYSFQARIGEMDGIFLAYHNTSRIYGFQYVPLTEMDQSLFGSSEVAEVVFKFVVSIFEILLDSCVTAFPGMDVKALIRHTPTIHRHSVTAYVQPRTWDESQGSCPVQAVTIIMENYVNDQLMDSPMMTYMSADESNWISDWIIKYTIQKSDMDGDSQAQIRKILNEHLQSLIAMATLYVPEGQSVESMSKMYQERQGAIEAGIHPANFETLPKQSSPSSLGKNTAEHDDFEPYSDSSKNVENTGAMVIQWKQPSRHTLRLRREAKASGQAYEKRKSTWKWLLRKTSLNILNLASKFICPALDSLKKYCNYGTYLRA